jgi:hypothetical protein
MQSSSNADRSPRKSRHERVRPATQVYLTFVAALEERRRELGLPMAQVDDLAGLQDGFLSKLTRPDALNGRQSRWETIDLVVQALFGTDYRIHIVAQNFRAPAKLETRAKPSSKVIEVKHWRHRKLFSDLGKRGAAAYKALSPERRSEIAKKAAATRLANRRAAAAGSEVGAQS